MTEYVVNCGCGRMMSLDGRRGRGAYRCGCGARVTVVPSRISSRTCWYPDCRESPSTEDPVSLCREHEKDVAVRVAHVLAINSIGSFFDARNEAGSEWYRPLDSRRKKPSESEQGWVYFMRREHLIKIGTTCDLRRRAGQLNAAILARTPGSYTLEAQLHARFAASRRHGEWFEPTPELLAMINDLRKKEGSPPISA